MSNVYILIPAREGSKGLPHKNRKLLDSTLNIIPSHYKNNTYISTDDESIINKCKNERFNFYKRNRGTANDKASMKGVILEFIKRKKLGYNDIIITLYLTYPERKWDDVINTFNFFKGKKANSLLCKKDVKTHPYLCMLDNGIYGKQITPHNLYRRQDYPKCFEISHYVSIVKVSEINKLNNNLYNDNTVFHKIGDPVDVDTQDDLDKIDVKKKEIEKVNVEVEKQDVIQNINNKPRYIKKNKDITKVLILGNDRTLKNLDSTMIPEDFITIGINRSYLHIESDYLFFNDLDILIEMKKKRFNKKTKTKFISSDWLYNRKNRKPDYALKALCKEYKVKYYKRLNFKKFPDSVTTAIEIFDKYIFKDKKVEYYIYGVSLKYDNDENHFWTNTEKTLNNKGGDWYIPRFDRIYNNFVELKSKYNIISCSEYSRINDIFNYINIKNLK